MKSHALILGSAMLLVTGTLACAQQQQPHMQYDSLGSPTPRPQEASPTQAEPNVPVPAGKSAPSTPDRSTTGAAPKSEPSGTTANSPGTSHGAMPNDGKTPSGLTPD